MLGYAADKILKVIRNHGPGWVFSQRDLAGIGARDAVDKALQRLLQKGTIRRVIRGLYDYPPPDLLAPPMGPLRSGGCLWIPVRQREDETRFGPSRPGALSNAMDRAGSNGLLPETGSDHPRSDCPGWELGSGLVQRKI